MPEYEITSEVLRNEEGSESIEVTIKWADGVVQHEHFVSWFDNPGPSASEQAASFVAALEEAQNYTLEERLGPYGIEWEREQMERYGHELHAPNLYLRAHDMEPAYDPDDLPF